MARSHGIRLILQKLWNQLFSRPDEDLSSWKVILWWELRRIPYNLILGMVAFISLGVVVVLWKLTPPTPSEGMDLGDPFLAIMLAPFLINGCYTLGWLGELTLRHLWKTNDRSIGPALFKLGVTFSIIMMTFPAMFFFLLWM